MNRDKAKLILKQALALAGTFVLSMVIMNALPSSRERRQLSFAQATMDGNLTRMRLLHLAGADINGRGNSVMPLFLAASEGKLEAVRYLLDEGADVNARENLGGTALTEAAYYGHIEVIKELLLRGSDINAISAQGTPVDLAIIGKKAAAADLLRHHGGKTVREIRNGG